MRGLMYGHPYSYPNIHPRYWTFPAMASEKCFTNKASCLAIGNNYYLKA